jgi:hypothetical protein
LKFLLLGGLPPNADVLPLACLATDPAAGGFVALGDFIILKPIFVVKMVINKIF